MRAAPRSLARAAAVAALAVVWAATLHGQQGFKFKSGVELVNVNVTVTDRSGRFVPGLTQNDFVVYDDGSEHAPVALDGPDAVPCVLLALAHEGIKLLAG